MRSVGVPERAIARRDDSEADAAQRGWAPRSAAALEAALRGARDYTLGLYAHLSESQQHFPQIAIVNPPRWELGHIGWFQEFWCRRYRPDDPAGVRTPSRIANADALWNSSTVPHATRWSLPLPAWPALHAYLDATLADTLETLAASRDGERYYFELALYHEDMHAEALLMTLQSLALPPPTAFAEPRSLVSAAASSDASGDVAVPGGELALGTARGDRQTSLRLRQREMGACRPRRAVRDRAVLRDQQRNSRRSSPTAATAGPSCGRTPDARGSPRPDAHRPRIGCAMEARGKRAGSIAGVRSMRTRRSSTSRHSRRTRTAAGPAGVCRPKPSGNARRGSGCPRKATIGHGRPPRATPTSTPSPARPSRSTHSPMQHPIVLRRCWVMSGNGRRRRSVRIRASPPIPTPTIRRRGSAIITCCAAVRGRRARASSITASATSIGPSATTPSWAFARAHEQRGDPRDARDIARRCDIPPQFRGEM